MAGVGRARLWFTDRYGPDGSGRQNSPPTSSPYGAFNLGDHVGDVPSDVTDRRRQLARVPVAFMQQVHGNSVAVLTDSPAQPIPATDALVTAVRNLPLAVLVADCLPVLIYEPKVEV